MLTTILHDVLGVNGPSSPTPRHAVSTRAWGVPHREVLGGVAHQTSVLTRSLDTRARPGLAVGAPNEDSRDAER
eukprot:401166-Lingulodinium_polyedra.AAC.1